MVFGNYKNLNSYYRYCHEWAVATFPPSIYKVDKGDEFVWNDFLKYFKPVVIQLYYKDMGTVFWHINYPILVILFFC
jgi:hypothetical protein